jgi:hypothetical protein
MSLYIDVKYLNQVGGRLELFKRKGDYLYNCRCPICGDSQTKKNKTRGYFYKQSNDLYFKCHNCDASQHFGTFLKNFDANLYREYSMERYANGENRRPHANPEPELKLQFAEPVFVTPPERNFLDELMTRVSDLPAGHECRIFCDKRGISEHSLQRLYFIDNIKDIEQLSPKYKDTIRTTEPRLVIPFRDQTGRLVGVSCRGLRDESLRYITVRIREEAPLIFGLDIIDQTKKMYAVEGPIDSLFLPNALAVGGTGFNKLDELGLNQQNLTVIVDNQPRNTEVCKVYNRLVSAGYKIFIWPEYTNAKDINDLASLGIGGSELCNLIDSHTYSGLAAQIKFNQWKRI